ncbi:hypothetical protein MSG28_002378 [Choristoneura fumiferana]|uniref:Uncharacterized protein n=1 Tax=Choristoneura fumiferana TaxID=7141 RepID=A0ACC0JVE8_CHOFU|nr:hypothetical protein MSG28_002378 [Choristoneura fumiferana]
MLRARRQQEHLWMLRRGRAARNWRCQESSLRSVNESARAAEQKAHMHTHAAAHAAGGGGLRCQERSLSRSAGGRASWFAGLRSCRSVLRLMSGVNSIRSHAELTACACATFWPGTVACSTSSRVGKALFESVKSVLFRSPTSDYASPDRCIYNYLFTNSRQCESRKQDKRDSNDYH